MALKCVGAVCLLGRCMQSNLPLVSRVISYPNNDGQSVRFKHWNPKFKELRKKKVIKIDLPNFNENLDAEITDDQRQHLKNIGILPEKMYSERGIYFSCSREIFDSYVVPEGDGIYSTISAEGALQKLDIMKHKGQSIMAIRKIKQFDDLFSTSHFGQEATEIYIKAHEALVKKDTDEILKYATESAYQQMISNIWNKTIRWKYLLSLVPARVVHARCRPIIVENNMFAQVTVRLHSQQMLSIYDRFGRLMQGSEILAKDVLEYVVFEKHISNVYGTWRLHSKIKPSWMPPREHVEKTYIKPAKRPVVGDSEDEEFASVSENVEPLSSSPSQS